MPRKCQRNSHVHFACPLLASWTTSLSRRGGPGSLRVACSILPWSRKHLTLTCPYKAGHACCSTATEQMWVLPNGSVDGPERNNKQFALFLPSYLRPFYPPPAPPNPMRYKPNATAVKKCAGAGSVFCQFLLTSELTEFRYVQHTPSSGFFMCLTLWNDALLWFLSLPMYVLDVCTAVGELEGGDALACFSMAICETEF